MNSSSANFLDALGASQTLSAQMKHELDTLGYTVVHNVVDAQWLSEMRLLIDTLVEREGDNLAMEHHQEATATRIANLINKGVIWEKVWSHPLILSACRYIFNGDFKVSSLNAREALYNGGHQPLHADWKKSAANGAPRIIPGTHLRPELPEEVLADPEQAHPDEIVFAAPAGSVMIYNAHAWHGGTRNREGSRRRVLHGLYIDRADLTQILMGLLHNGFTLHRLTPAQKWLMDVE